MSCSQRQLEQIHRSNPQLGWCYLSGTFPSLGSLKLFNDFAMFGKQASRNVETCFIFDEGNTPADILQKLSRLHFMIFRKPSDGVNLHPARIAVYGRNGIYVGKTFVAQNETCLLRDFDYIGITPDKPLFQFLDDRQFGLSGLPRKMLKKYHINSYIGQGGQSSVRKIHKFETDEKFALKIIPKTRNNEESVEEHAKRLSHMTNEVEIIRQLSHVNIIRFVETFEKPQELFIVMEYAMRNLCDLLKLFPKKSLPEPEAKSCFYQISKGLAHIHERNIAHRDLKVENIFVKTQPTTGETIYKIGDFGYSKRTQLGSASYLPPEIQAGGCEYTLKADIWSLGCLFYACLSASFPFHYSYEIPLQEQTANAGLQCTSSQWKFISGLILKAIGQMKHVDPERRPTAKEVLRGAWFNDSELKARMNKIYEAFPVVEVTKRMSSANLVAPEPKKAKH